MRKSRTDSRRPFAAAAMLSVAATAGVCALVSCPFTALAQDVRNPRPPARPAAYAAWAIGAAKVGVYKDGSTWATTLWLIAPRSAPNDTKRGARAAVAFLDRSFKPLPVSVQLPGAEPRVASSLAVVLPINADRGIVLTGADASSPASLFTIRVQVPPGYLVFALPQYRDKSGLPSRVYDETASTSGTVTATEFGLAFDITAGRDMQLIMYNPRDADLPVLLQAYDTASNEPYVSVSLTLPAQAPGYKGSFSARMLSDILGDNAEYAARRRTGRVQGVLRLYAMDTFAVNAGQLDVVNENGYAILSLAMQGVKMADTRRAVQ